MTESVTATIVASVAAIVDASGTVWTLINSATSGMQVAKNGVIDPTTANVKELAYFNHGVYQQNTAGNWWLDHAGSWVSAINPTIPPIVIPPVAVVSSKDDATLASTTGSIIDSKLMVWTLVSSATSGLQIAKNGVVDSTTANVTLLLFHANSIFQQNAAGGWWQWTTSWVPSSNPVAVVTPPPTGPTIPAGPIGIGPAASGSFVNVDFSKIGQTVSQYVWGVGAGLLISNNYPPSATHSMGNGQVQQALSSMAYPLLRINGISIGLQTFFNGGSSASSSNLSNWLGFFINNIYSCFPKTVRIIFGIGADLSSWHSPADYAGACSTVAKWFKTTNSSATGAPVPIYGFEIANETNNASMSHDTYNSYFNAASAAIKAVDPNYKIFGPVYSWADGIGSFMNACGSHCDVIDYHYYPYGGQGQFDGQGGTGFILGGANNGFGNSIKQGIVGNTPICLGEWNQNNLPGTSRGGDSPGSCNVHQCDYVGAVFNAQSILQGLNTSNNFTMAANWEVFQDSDYGLLGAAETPGGAFISPVGYFMSKAAATMYGSRATVSGGNLNCLAVTGGPGPGHCAVMLINGSQSNAQSGQVALSHWPVNASGTATINQWIVGQNNSTPSLAATGLNVTAGLTSTITVPPASVVILYN